MATVTNLKAYPVEVDFLYFVDRHRTTMSAGAVVTVPADFLSVVTDRYAPRLRRAYERALSLGQVAYAAAFTAPESPTPVATVTAPVAAVTAPVAEPEPEPVIEPVSAAAGEPAVADAVEDVTADGFDEPADDVPNDDE